jgi:two-component system sensor histidine kinase HydH
MGQPRAADGSFSSRKFCDYIAHELASPLNGMLMSAEIIEQYFEANPRAVDEIGDAPRILRKEIHRLIGLLKELRCSRVLVDVNLRSTSLADELGEMLALQSTYYEQRRVRIDHNGPTDLPCIMADRNKLRQVLLNLCNNAVEAMPDGGLLTLRSYLSEPWVCLDITDTGDGIPEAMPIFEAAVSGKAGNSGLGLALVRQIVRQHNGMVSYTTTPGKGTTFHLKFPIEAGQTLEQPAL